MSYLLRLRWRKLATRASTCVLALLFCCISPHVLRAESLFGLNFLGERVEAGDVRSISLGGATQLIPDSLGVIQRNPALLARIGRVTIGATQFLAVDEGRSTEISERDVSFTFAGFRLAFPIGNYLVLSGGYSGRYNPGGSFSERDATNDGSAFTTTFRRSGGLFSIPLGVSFNLSRYLAIGLTYSLERGFVEDRVEVVFDDEAFVPGAGRKKEDFGGSSFGGGVVISPTKDLMIGATFESSVDYDNDVLQRFTQSTLDTTFTTTAKLPSSASAGISWRVSNILVAASAGWRDFTEFNGIEFPSDRLDKEQTIAFGFEYLDGVPLRGRRYPLRVSFSFEKLPYEHPAGASVNKVLVGLGTGFALTGGRGKIDIGLQVGRVGELDANGLEDRLVRLYIGVSGSEAWKRKAGQGF